MGNLESREFRQSDDLAAVDEMFPGLQDPAKCSMNDSSDGACIDDDVPAAVVPGSFNLPSPPRIGVLPTPPEQP